QPWLSKRNAVTERAWRRLTCRGHIQKQYINNSKTHSEAGSAGKALRYKAMQPSMVMMMSKPPSQREGWRWSSNESAGLDTIQYHPHNAFEIRVFRLTALHEPAEHILVLTLKQLPVPRLILLI